jgi:hypothetical protein
MKELFLEILLSKVKPVIPSLLRRPIYSEIRRPDRDLKF